MPIVEMRGYHDYELDITFIVSHSIRSVYVHCMNIKFKMTQIFDRHMHGLEIDGLIARHMICVGFEVLVYGQRDTRGDIVHMKLNFNADEIRKLK